MTSVIDGGGGVDESEQLLVFEKHDRGKNHRQVVEGTAMGLPIASAIVKAHSRPHGFRTGRVGAAFFFLFADRSAAMSDKH
jgi:K+-sensing histidine kinase KdpD